MVGKATGQRLSNQSRRHDLVLLCLFCGLEIAGKEVHFPEHCTSTNDPDHGLFDVDADETALVGKHIDTFPKISPSVASSSANQYSR